MKQLLETVQTQMTAKEFLESKGLHPKLYFVAQRKGQELIILKPNEKINEGAELRAIPIIAGG